MGNFQRGGNRGGFGGGRGGDRGGDRGGFQKKSWGGDRGGDRGGRDAVTMHRATCATCGKSCEVPFRPNGEKPVYCNDCFGGKKDNGDRGDRRDFRSAEPRREYDTRTSHAAPIQSPAPKVDELKKQVTELTSKVDRLAYILETYIASKGEGKKEAKDKNFVTISDAKPVAKAPVKKEATLKATIKKVVAKKAPAAKKKAAPKKK